MTTWVQIWVLKYLSMSSNVDHSSFPLGPFHTSVSERAFGCRVFTSSGVQWGLSQDAFHAHRKRLERQSQLLVAMGPFTGAFPYDINYQLFWNPVAHYCRVRSEAEWAFPRVCTASA